MSKANKLPLTSRLNFITRRLSLKPDKGERSLNDILTSNLGGKITKMKLLAINNRSVFIHSKIRRAEQDLICPSTLKQQQPKKLKTDVYSHLIELNSQNHRLIQRLRTDPSESADSNKLPSSKLFYQLHLSKLMGKKNSQSKVEIKVQKSPKLNNSNLSIRSFEKVAKSESKLRQKAVIERQRMLFENEYKKNLLKIKEVSEFQQKLRRLKQKSFERKFKLNRGMQSSFAKVVEY